MYPSAPTHNSHATHRNCTKRKLPNSSLFIQGQITHPRPRVPPVTNAVFPSKFHLSATEEEEEDKDLDAMASQSAVSLTHKNLLLQRCDQTEVWRSSALANKKLSLSHPWRQFRFQFPLWMSLQKKGLILSSIESIRPYRQSHTQLMWFHILHHIWRPVNFVLE